MRVRRLAPIVLLLPAVLAGACARNPPRTEPVPPPLEAPAPPPRLIPALEPEVAAVAPLPTAEAPARPPRRPAPPTSKADPPKVDPVPAIKLEDVKPPTVEAPPAGDLQIKPPGSEGEDEKRIRTLLNQARNDLGRIRYQGLDRDGKKQYDTVNEFVKQAEQALKEKNFVFALKLADKAATLAASLAG
jgi:hypothetical protein